MTAVHSYTLFFSDTQFVALVVASDKSDGVDDTPLAAVVSAGGFFFTTEREHRRWALGADDGDTKDFDASFEDELRC